MVIAAQEAAEEAGAGRLWRFGNAELDERTLELRVDGELAALEPKPMEVLFHLLHHAGEVVTKDELAEACWPRRVLSDTVLTKTISRLREVLQDENQAVIRTIHGYGYRLVAQVSVVAATSTAAAAPKLGFKAGDHLPLRPQWGLVERLGSGRSGEAWLARHDKTNELRVYKFPLDVLALSSLKREITLSRLLAEAGSGRIARVLDWNLEQEPYFIESEYAAGGNLIQWANTLGGLSKLPLAVRVDLAAQVAETLAAAHSVGVLHKDLKPANVLVDTTDAAPRIKLADFGSGGVLDPERLEALGLTRLGFTRTIAAADASSGTPLYLAPELLAGQPATVQADIYAVGVMLYQLAVGDFRRSLAPGWELEIPDELLREDIAAAAAGDPRRRLADASALAQRLRSLDERRAERARQRAAQAEAETARIALERLQVRRKWMLAVVGVLSAGVVISLALFMDARRARNEAAHAAAASRAVADFLSTDLFANISSEERPPNQWTVAQLLDAASGQIDKRFAGQPEVAQQIHAALGGAYYTLEMLAPSQSHLRSALKLASEQFGEDSPQALQAADKLVVLDYVTADLRRTLPDYERMLATGQQRLGARHAEVQKLRRHLAWAYGLYGEWQKALVEARVLVDTTAQDAATDPEARAAAERSLGNVLFDLGLYAESERTLQAAMTHQAEVPKGGEMSKAILRINRIQPLIALGRYAEAQTEITAAMEVIQRWAVNDGSGIRAVPQLLQARLDLEQGRAQDAARVLEAAMPQTLPDKSSDQDMSAIYREPLAQAYQRLHRFADAAATMRESLRISESNDGTGHPDSLRIRIELADILREQGQPDQAWAVLRAADAKAYAKLPADHPIIAQQREIEGLLYRAQGQRDKARSALTEALRIFSAHHGENNWRARRVSQELAGLSDAGG